MQLPQPVPILCLVAAISSMCGETTAVAGHRDLPSPRLQAWPGAWVPYPPPPSAELWAAFWTLYLGYESLPAPKPCSFEEWVCRHGVRDPDVVRLMMAFYQIIRPSHSA